MKSDEELEFEIERMDERENARLRLILIRDNDELGFVLSREDVVDSLNVVIEYLSTHDPYLLVEPSAN